MESPIKKRASKPNATKRARLPAKNPRKNRVREHALFLLRERNGGVIGSTFEVRVIGEASSESSEAPERASLSFPAASASVLRRFLLQHLAVAGRLPSRRVPGECSIEVRKHVDPAIHISSQLELWGTHIDVQKA